MLHTWNTYDVSKDSWYSPDHILENFEILRSVMGEKVMEPEFKRAREMFAAAVALLGAYELSPENKYWLQSNVQSNSPDVMAGKLTQQSEGMVLLEACQLEIVDFETHYEGKNDVIEFLLQTKLSPRAAYDNNTMILVMVNRKVPMNTQDIQKRLTELSPKPTVYIVGHPEGSGMGDFAIMAAYPTLLPHAVKFNVNTTAKKYSIPFRVSLSRGPAKTISFDKTHLENKNVYDILGLDKKRIEKKFGKKS